MKEDSFQNGSFAICENQQAKENGKDSMDIMEDALLLCKFGKFHIRLLFTTLAALCASTLVTTSTSYILPNAECDLNMNVMQKGLLNSMPFFVMVSEFIHKNLRDRILLLVASFMSMSLIIAALMSWAVLPHNLDYVLVEGYFELHSWNIYFYVCSVWSLVAAVSYYFLPESPKFLLSHGQKSEALEVLKHIYSVNTGNEKDTFPIKTLHVEVTVTASTSKDSFKKQITNAMFEVKNLFRKPLFGRLMLFSTMTFACLLAYSALRLWYPQISTIVENYQTKHNKTDWFCEIITDYTDPSNQFKGNVSFLENNPTENRTQICVPNISGSGTYINGIILGCMSLVGILTSTYTVGFFGHKPLMFILLLICASCSSALYWTNTLLPIALLISATCGFMQTALSLQQNLLVRVFPTTLRALSIQIILMIGRIGSLLGSILFPVMLSYGCMVPFVTLSAITLAVAGLVFFLPNPNDETGDK